ncbi:MAG TPA: mechanosensitive ion channel, partial [Bacteroidales bacterium]|nr:mechanosensitive ion channel [Bacteroidales bacterium]
RPYLENKLKEIEVYNQSVAFDKEKPINGRWLTNLGTFRMYAFEYIKSMGFIRKDMSMMVRQLAPTEYGVPLEVYAFSSIIEWEDFEKIQADIFDHLMAVIPIFNLCIYQNPTGNDFSKILKNVEHK